MIKPTYMTIEEVSEFVLMNASPISEFIKSAFKIYAAPVPNNFEGFFNEVIVPAQRNEKKLGITDLLSVLDKFSIQGQSNEFRCGCSLLASLVRSKYHEKKHRRVIKINTRNLHPAMMEDN